MTTWESFEYPLSEIEVAFAAHRSANHWIRSDDLSPALSGEDEKRLAWNGLIAVRLGSERPDGRIGEASIGIVDRIRHEETGKERRFAEYLRIFERLRRAMRKELVVETEYRQPHGERSPDWRMTARAADAHVRGEVRFAAEPVGLRS